MNYSFALTKCIVHGHALFLNLILDCWSQSYQPVNVPSVVVIAFVVVVRALLLTTPRCRTCTKSFQHLFNRTQAAHYGPVSLVFIGVRDATVT